MPKNARFLRNVAPAIAVVVSYAESMRHLLVVVSLVWVAACSKSNPASSTVAPTSAATVSSVRILNASEALLVGTSRTFQALAYMSDSTTQVVSASWTSNNPGIVTMNGATAIGMSPGTASVRAAMQSQWDQQPVVVVPNFGGRWDGDFQVAACNAGPFVTTTYLCVDEFSVGSPIPVSIMLTQAADHVSGSVSMTAASGASGKWSNVFKGTVYGVIDGNGQLSLQGELIGVGPERNGSVFRVIIRNWTATMAGNQLPSTWTMEFRQDGVAGSGTVIATTPGLSLTRAQ